MPYCSIAFTGISYPFDTYDVDYDDEIWKHVYIKYLGADPAHYHGALTPYLAAVKKSDRCFVFLTSFFASIRVSLSLVFPMRQSLPMRTLYKPQSATIEPCPERRRSNYWLKYEKQQKKLIFFKLKKIRSTTTASREPWRWTRREIVPAFAVIRKKIWATYIYILGILATLLNVNARFDKSPIPDANIVYNVGSYVSMDSREAPIVEIFDGYSYYHRLQIGYAFANTTFTNTRTYLRWRLLSTFILLELSSCSLGFLVATITRISSIWRRFCRRLTIARTAAVAICFKTIRYSSTSTAFASRWTRACVARSRARAIPATRVATVPTSSARIARTDCASRKDLRSRRMHPFQLHFFLLF